MIALEVILLPEVDLCSPAFLINHLGFCRERIREKSATDSKMLGPFIVLSHGERSFLIPIPSLNEEYPVSFWMFVVFSIFRPDVMVITSEVWRKQVSMEEAEKLRHGDLAEEEEKEEALSIFFIDLQNYDSKFFLVPIVGRDTGIPVFGDPEISHPFKGEVLRTINRMFEIRRGITKDRA